MVVPEVFKRFAATEIAVCTWGLTRRKAENTNFQIRQSQGVLLKNWHFILQLQQSRIIHLVSSEA